MQKEFSAPLDRGLLKNSLLKRLVAGGLVSSFLGLYAPYAAMAFAQSTPAEHTQQAQKAKSPAIKPPAWQQTPTLLTYDELVQLAQEAKVSDELNHKALRVLNTPFIYRNRAAAAPLPVMHEEKKKDPRAVSGPALRVASWNIERGFHVDEIANRFLSASEDPRLEQAKRDVLDFSAPDEAASAVSSDEGLIGFAQNKESQEAWKWLAKSQVLFLSELDNGVGRTGYRDIAGELAERLHMNAVYGVEFLELGPLSKEMREYAKKHGNRIEVAGENFDVDPAQYKGMHGSAILSRYPVLDAQIIRLPDCYDWLNKEKEKISKLEAVKRTAADKIFQEIMLTEVRKGGRMALAVDLSIPELPEKKATFVMVHLENRCKSDCRTRQMKYLLRKMQTRRNPVVFGGDLNTSGGDASPTSVKKEVRKLLKDPAFWTRSVIGLVVPFGFVANTGIVLSKYTKNYHNPATPSIPLILPNPEYQFFQLLKAFRFSDGATLDFRGDDRHAYQGRGGFMANSNQRAIKGFEPTFSFERPLLKGFLGTYKLDWFIVKGYYSKSNEKTQDDYFFAPVYGRTLSEINEGYKKAYEAEMARQKKLDKKAAKAETSKDDAPTAKRSEEAMLLESDVDSEDVSGATKTYDRLSDHDPITVDLLLSKLNAKSQKSKKK